jgi:CheY-like chemotaxis protein
MMQTILVIDDDKDYRADIKELLELEQYQMLEAEDGFIGWQMIRRYSPDLVICDVDMPIMNGIEVLKQVKSTASLANIPFVILSGQDECILLSAFKLGANGVLRKPVDIRVLLSAIKPYLQNKAVVL